MSAHPRKMLKEVKQMLATYGIEVIGDELGKKHRRLRITCRCSEDFAQRRQDLQSYLVLCITFLTFDSLTMKPQEVLHIVSGKLVTLCLTGYLVVHQRHSSIVGYLVGIQHSPNLQHSIGQYAFIISWSNHVRHLM